MTSKFKTLMAGIAAGALLASCAAIEAPGFGDGATGCKTIYVFRATGGIQPISNCGGLPRDELVPQSLKPQSLEAPQSADGQPQPAAVTATPVSPAARATAPYDKPAKGYPGANEMLENADMAAFMGRVRSDYAKKDNSGAWGYMIIDALAANDTVTAQQVLDAMSGRPAPEMLSASHLRPWVDGFAGRGADAQSEMARLRRLLPGAALIGHRALLAEGLGDINGAITIYQEAPDKFDSPKPDEAQSPTYLARAMAFTSQRLLALRQAELLRVANKDADAVALLTKLLEAAPDDIYVQRRLEMAKTGKDRDKARTLKQAMAVALSDEADLVEQRQTIMGYMVSRGAKTPFNHLLSSLRQSALLLDPDNGDIRIQEVSTLYSQGKFEPALRMAQLGNPDAEHMSSLYSTAGLAALQLGSADTLEKMTDLALKIDNKPESKVQAASALTTANKTDRAIQLIDQAIKQGLSKDQQVFALMSKGQAQLQAGNVAGAVDAGRTANKMRDDDDTKQFLASMLVESPQRQEGLQIMRDMLKDQPENTGLMNNFGYSLIDNHASDAELDEGFTLLKQAIRLTPDEPNLLDSIGWAYYEYGDFREANRFIAMALEAYEPFAHWELSNHMGDIQWRLGDQAAARKNWQHSLDSYPPAKDRAAIEAKLKVGLTTPAPVRRDTPEVPITKERGGVSDI